MDEVGTIKKKDITEREVTNEAELEGRIFYDRMVMQDSDGDRLDRGVSERRLISPVARTSPTSEIPVCR